MPAGIRHTPGHLDKDKVADEEGSDEGADGGDEYDDEDEYDSYDEEEDEDPEEAKADYFERIGQFMHRIDDETWAVREVNGTHHRPCTYCGHDDWQPGEIYIKERHLCRYDRFNPIKVCEGCIEDWLDEHGYDTDPEFEPDQEEFFEEHPYWDREVDDSDFSESGAEEDEDDYDDDYDEDDGELDADNNGADAAAPPAEHQPPKPVLLPVFEDRTGSRPGEQERRIVY